MGRKAKISEKPMKEINIAAEEVASEAASIATPAPEEACLRVSVNYSNFSKSFGSICSGSSLSIRFVDRVFPF